MGRSLLFRELAELQSPMEAATTPAQLFHCQSALGMEEQPTPPSLTLLPLERAVVGSAEEAESFAKQFCLLSIGGNTLLESAGPGVWVGSPVPTDCSADGDRPSAVRRIVIVTRQPSPRGRGLIAGSRE